MMKVKVLFISTLLLVVMCLPTALIYSVEIREGGAGDFVVGVNWFDISDLNSDLKEAGYKAFDKYTFNFGGEGYGIIGGRIIIGGEGHGFSQEVSTSTHFETLSGGYGLFNVGYVAFSKWGLRLFPMIGLGGGGIELRITENVSPSFSDIMNDPKQEASLSTGGFIGQGAVGLDYVIILSGDEEGEGGLLFGIRAGYLLSFTSSSWEMGKIDIAGGPDVRFNGFYIRFIIGGAGYEI